MSSHCRNTILTRKVCDFTLLAFALGDQLFWACAWRGQEHSQPRMTLMSTPEPSIPTTQLDAVGFAPLSARRLLTLAGIGMILVGMVFGDIFAVFVLHQNAARVGASLTAAAQAAQAGDSTAVAEH